MMEYVQHLLMRLFWVFVIMLVVENGCNGCWEKERIALLQLKESINFPNRTSLPSWEEDDYLDCCQWERVTCNFTTHRVIKLSLNTSREWRRDDYWYLNASILLPFEYLQSLDLSWNQLHGFLGNEGIGILSNLSNLKELDLHANYLENSILLSLNKLSNLKILNLAGNELNGSISINGIGTLSNLSNLEELDLSSNALGNSILPSLNKLSNLKILNLAGNRLNGSISINGIGTLSNLSNLEELDLRWNYELGNSILPSLNKLSNLKILNLHNSGLNGSISINEFDGLNNLKELDLSMNEVANMIVTGSREESGILNKLEVLDLSYNKFDDTIWSIFRELSSIKALDLRNNSDLHGAGHNNGICNLKTLQELDIARTGFRGTLPWCLVNLTSLRLLDITSNHFTGNIAQSPLINLTSLEYLAISDNDFEVPISFKSFFNHSKLKVVESLNNKLLEEEDFLATSPSFQLIGFRLSNSGRITRSFPHFLYHQHDLKMVELSQIGFSGKFPNWLLDNNVRMETLLLPSNSFGGPFLFPSLHTRKLLALDISNNYLEGFIPYETASYFPSLEFLNMSTNNFEGYIPSSFGEMTALSILDLSSNRLSGKIPVHLVIGCRRLEFLKLSNNNLKGPILPPQNNLTQLYTMYSDNNGFTEIPSSLSLSPLTWLNASANQLVGKIPGFIGNMSFFLLAMAGNRLEGPIPTEFCQLKYLWLLDLSENNITGAVPSCFNSSVIQSIRLSKNRLHGPFPTAFQNLSRITELDLSYNQFGGNIPHSIGSLSYLTVLLLQNNHFEGNIPKELCQLSNLSLIDLSSNNLSGSIIPCISNVKFNGIPGKYDSSYYLADGYSPPQFRVLLHELGMVSMDDKMQNGRIINDVHPLEEVKFATKGMSLTYKGTVLHLFSGINLSHNRLTGPIPPEIGNLTHIKVLNFSHNYLTGTIPETFSNLKSIECLDLSYNNLSGKIPSQLTELYSLAVFNLSYNNLSGSTPPPISQFATFDQSNSYVGNPFLCGEPLPRKCNATYSPPPTPRAAINGTEDSDFMDMDTFYMSFVGSYLTVVLAIVAILFINPYWRRAWFHLVEVFLTSSYYFVVDNLVYPVRGFLWK